MTKRYRFWSTIASFCAAFAASRAGAQSPTLRFQIDQHGDFALIGNTLGQDCANGTPAPVVGTVGACGSDVSDSSPDVSWRADSPSAGDAEANTSITAASARSTAVLSLPATASVTYARLYWAAMSSTALADSGASVERPGVFAAALAADVQHTLMAGDDLIYESSADVTELVREHGSGAYRVGDVDSIALSDMSGSRPFVFWSMVVVYELSTDPLRQLTVFDGLASADTGSGVVVNVSGFLVPTAGIDAKLGVLAYGTDGQTGGDRLGFNTVPASDGLGGTNNFFNGSRTYLGVPVSVAGDLPQLTGGERSFAGVDLDVIDVSDVVSPGSTSANIEAKAGGDMNVMIGGVFTSITTFRPNFNGSIKTATDLNGGLLLPGDVLRYTIDVVNTGSDPAVDVELQDVIPFGLDYVPGSITVTDGFTDGVKTDQAGDDQGEFDSATRTVRVRLGDGAGASTGGRITIGGTATVVFEVTISDSIVGVVQNRVTISAAGEMGTPEATYTTTDGAGSNTTDVVIDQCGVPADCPASLPQCLIAADPLQPNLCVECLNDASCGGTRPVCDLTDHSCVPCGDDGDCTIPTTPACQMSGGALEGACTECSAGNDDLCTSAKPQCLPQGICGCDDTDGDSECGASDSGIVCNGPSGLCVPGCSTAPGRNGCPAGKFCSDLTGAVGVCLPSDCAGDGDCAAPTPFCDVAGDPDVCVQCRGDDDCIAPLVCDVGDTRTCVECVDGAQCSIDGAGAACLADATCGCATDTDCGSASSGRVCDPSSQICVVGCRGEGGNGCPTTQVCTSTDATIGECVACVQDDDCPGTAPRCDTLSNTCVECLDAGDCIDLAAPACEDGECIGCRDDDDCKDPLLPSCQLSGARAGTCTECSDGNITRCDADHPICLPSAVCGCIDTDGDSECGASDSGRVCNGPAGSCVDGCSTAPSRNDCPSTEVCSEQGGDIGMCLSQTCNVDADCTVSPLLVCDTTVTYHVCVECVGNDDCAADEVCDVAARQCVGCLDDDDCPSDQLCHPTQQVCVGCIDDRDCAENELCDDITRTCVDCVDDGDCENDQRCDTDPHVCVDCLEDGDCAGGQVCDPADRSCVDCVNDDDCDGDDVCDGSVHECVGCVDDGDCSATEVCDGTVQQCVGCVADDDCDTDQVCDTGIRACVECVADDDCETDQVCDTTAQQCVGCLADTDCSGPMVCDATADTCVGCLDDGDCENGQVCDPDTTTCVECTDTKADACSADDQGAMCLDDDTCGCITDADCGGSRSGRVCDDDGDTCVTGCRGEDGNGCPSHMMCSSIDSDIGQCEPQAPPAPDGIIEGGGCDCSVPSAGRSGPPPLALASLLLLATRLRRRLRAC